MDEYIENKKTLTKGYSVLVTDQERSASGSGLLYYPGGDTFYVFTCKHVIRDIKSDLLKIRILPFCLEDDNQEISIFVSKSEVVFPDKDKRDLAVIPVEKKKIPSLKQSKYYIDKARENEEVYVQGYPGGCVDGEDLHAAYDVTDGKVLCQVEASHKFTIRIIDNFMDHSNREDELKGFSGSPVWKTEGELLCVTGLLTDGFRYNANRSKVYAENINSIQAFMRERFKHVMRATDGITSGQATENIAVEDQQIEEISHEENPSDQDTITIVIKKGPNGTTLIANHDSLQSSILKWIKNGKDNRVHVEIEMQELKLLHSKYKKICNKINKSKRVTEKEKSIFTLYIEQDKLFSYWKQFDITACEMFLKNTTNQEYFEIMKPDDYIYILSKIVTRDETEFYRLVKNEEYSLMAFYDKDRKVVFKCPIKKEALPDHPVSCMYDEKFNHIYFKLDMNTKKLLLIRYYNSLARTVLASDSTIQSNINITELKNYFYGCG